jgi:hypothetical protein
LSLQQFGILLPLASRVGITPAPHGQEYGNSATPRHAFLACLPPSRISPISPMKSASRSRQYSQSLAIGLLALARDASSHSFGTQYTLPVPFWMYAYGASAALVASFAIVAYVARTPTLPAPIARRAVPLRLRLPEVLVALLGGLSLGLLALSIATGFVGTRDVYLNFNMTFFWLVFALGILYLSALIGDLYQFVNPWRVLCSTLFPGSGHRALLRYPPRLAYWPALLFYFAFIWIELFGESQPNSLAMVLLAYTAVNCVGAILFGQAEWFRYGEFFGIIFRLVGRIAPVRYERDNAGIHATFRAPLQGLLDDPPPTRLTLLLFVLFMLSSTAFDGFHETLPWVAFFWKHVYPLMPASADGYGSSVHLYYAWQQLMLLASPFIYLAVYLACVATSKMAAGSLKSLRDLALAFTLSLVPIAVAYNATHYLSLLASQGLQAVRLASDPFGLHWNLFGTANALSDPVILDASIVWHTQVALVLIGHIAGVYVAHVEALRSFAQTRRAIISQLPMLLMMVLFTVAGLWVLSLPIAGGQVGQPA